ncbi:MAG: YkgJ family cysteine cluster protein [Deltaproteobacteria bacterium]|nr:YkgJ family cysteine cluster protein [Deltaproteobacteria bacterium]
MTTHPAGLTAGDGSRACADCAWALAVPGGHRCVAAAAPDAAGPFLPPGTLACTGWEPPVRCEPCGACCREAFDAVPVEDDDPTARDFPELVLGDPGGWREIRRVPSPSGCGTRCAALRGDGSEPAPFRCAIYASRATACRDLEPGSPNCHLARVRANLSRPTHTSVAGPRSVP